MVTKTAVERSFCRHLQQRLAEISQRSSVSQTATVADVGMCVEKVGSCGRWDLQTVS
jgi:hypothetical protein